MPTRVLPAVSISGNSFRTEVSGEIFGVLLWTFLPLGVMLAVVLVLGSVPRCGEMPAEELGLGVRFSI